MNENKSKMTCKEIAEQIIKLLKENNARIRGYEGETCCVIIEKDDENSDWAEIDNETQEITYIFEKDKLCINQ